MLPSARPSCAALFLTAFFVILSLALLASGTLNPVQAQSPDTIQVYSGPAAPPNPPSAEKFTLTGTVVDSVTGEPIRKALVQIYASQRRMTFSGDDGRFQLEGIPAGSYMIAAQKPGYFSQQELLRGGEPPVEVGPKR